MAVPLRADRAQPRPSKSHLHPSDGKSMSRDHLDTTERGSRESFSSIREDDSDLAQTFTSSRTSSHLASHEQAVEDATTPPGTMVEAHFRPPLTHPNSRLHGFWAPADSFKGWKQINVRGKLASKSFGDLQILNVDWRPTTRPAPSQPKSSRIPGGAPFEKLPIELLASIINLLVLDIPPGGISRRNVDLMSLLLTSKTLHAATLNSLYNRITIPHSRIFQKFLSHISAHPALGTIVRRLDFCHFNPAQLFSTEAERSQARNLTSETLLRCLELTPYLQEFLAQEYVDSDIDADVLHKLLTGLPRLQAIDFCGSSSQIFKAAFSTVVKSPLPVELPLRRLSLHKCRTLPSNVFEALLPRLPHLTHLDVAGTSITDHALASISTAARLTHLNLAKCTLLSADMVLAFITSHPAARSLIYLSLAHDVNTHQLLDVDDLSALLPALPHTLRSLSLNGSRMDAAAHIPLLLPLTKHLEELALGSGLTLRDLNSLFVPDEPDDEDKAAAMALDWIPHGLRFLDLSDLGSDGDQVDLGDLFGSDGCALLRQGVSEPLAVVEFGDDAFKRLKKSAASLSRAGWRTSECGSRAWLVRNDAAIDNGVSGRRGWKMGAESWGMRKVPVARAEVGGMYGSYMFARKL